MPDSGLTLSAKDRILTLEDEFRQQLLERLKATEDELSGISRDRPEYRQLVVRFPPLRSRRRMDLCDGRRWRNGATRTIAAQTITAPAMTACASRQRP